jgi:surfeit locus 1 family protein
MTKTKKRSIPVWATILTIAGFTVLCALGTWQVQRLSWKTSLIRELKAAERSYEDNEIAKPDFLRAMAGEKPFVFGYVDGVYQHEKEIAIGPRTRLGISGYHIITPFVMNDGSVLLVNRGWVPEDKLDRNTRRDALTKGRTKVYGMAQKPEKPNMFVPRNDPEDDQWFSLDFAEIAQARDLHQADMVPYVFYAKRLNPAAQVFPIPHDKDWSPPNNHLAYACFWFSMAGLFLIVYFIRFFR